jgi:glucokinase
MLLAGDIGGTKTDLAVFSLAADGIYLAGGIPLHIMNALQGPHFMESFKRKGRFVDLMREIPVHIVLTRAALLGAAVCGLESFRENA